MKRIVKFTTLFITLFLVFCTIFFFWASSPNLSEKDYTQYITNTYEQKTDTDSIFSVVSYNIGYLSGMTNNKAIEKPSSLFQTNLQKVKTAFKNLNADILAFQEIDYASARSYYVNQQDEIASLGYNYIAQAINWDENYVPFPYWPPSMHFGEILSGQSILSKYPLENHQRNILERVADAPFYRNALYLERLAQLATVTLNGKEVILINVHLEAFDKPTRMLQLDTVIELYLKYHNKYPTILLGDFNSQARDSSAAIQKLLNMPSIGCAAFDSLEPTNTYNTVKPFKRIDYIFYSKDFIRYIDGKVLTQFGQASDHFPVEMRFKLIDI